MKRICLCSILFFFIFTAHFTQQHAFQLYTGNGRKVSCSKMIKIVKKSDVVLFGEYHDNPIAHWLQFELASELAKEKKLVLGLEMLESDNQKLLDQYLSNEISYAVFDSVVRLWSNYPTDYAPIVELAKAEKSPVICTNIPRKYARMVFRNGGFNALDDISEEEKIFIAPLPILFDAELSQYKNMLEMMGGHGSADIVKAQAIKDATMAHFISKNFKEESVFLHLNGAYHSDFFQGILWYLMKIKPNLNYKTISTVNQKNVKKLHKDNRARADYILCVNNNMTKTH